jgi:dienelactone hydrolase
MLNGFIKFGICPLLALLIAGCAIHSPGHCHSQPNALADKFALLPSGPGDVSKPFVETELRGLHRTFSVFIPNECCLPDSKQKLPPFADPNRSPVLLCEELFTLSPHVLKLAQRLANEGFAVYVPILFGSAREDPNSALLAFQRSASFAFARPDWEANNPAADHRLIIDELAGLCRSIARRHPGKKMGAIGLCITGSFPLELLAETDIAAPVLSQPAIPIVAWNFHRRQSLGMSDEKMRRLRDIIVERHLEVLGFRFELDSISPPERFAYLRYLLGSAFIDATLPAADYIYHDGCPPNAHAVLTDGYSDWPNGQRETRGHFAFRQLVWFLKTHLRNSALPEPIFNSRSTSAALTFGLASPPEFCFMNRPFSADIDHGDSTEGAGAANAKHQIYKQGCKEL